MTKLLRCNWHNIYSLNNYKTFKKHCMFTVSVFVTCNRCNRIFVLVQIPFVLFHKSGVTRDLYQYIYTHVQAGVKLTDIEYFLKQMYHDAANLRTAPHDALSFVSTSIDSPGRQIVSNCFVRSYFENEHMYAQYTSEIPYKWLSCDHTFKVSANVGFWRKGVWVKQYDSLFCVLNECGQVVAWQLTKGTSFDKIKTLLTNLNARAKDRTSTTNFYIDNCSAWRGKLKEVFGDNVEVKLDLFHAVHAKNSQNDSKTWNERQCRQNNKA